MVHNKRSRLSFMKLGAVQVFSKEYPDYKVYKGWHAASLFVHVHLSVSNCCWKPCISTKGPMRRSSCSHVPIAGHLQFFRLPPKLPKPMSASASGSSSTSSSGSRPPFCARASRQLSGPPPTHALSDLWPPAQFPQVTRALGATALGRFL